MNIVKNDWAHYINCEFEQDYYIQLRAFLKAEYTERVIYPNPYDIFNALHLTAYARTKVVILGQDPYHGPDQAHGLSFSVKPGVPVPPSLQNMYKELNEDVGCSIPRHGHLLHWAEQGVLLLNTVLTVRAGQPQSHKGKGWERFTDKVIAVLNQREQPLVFLLWGKHAQEKQAILTAPQHYIIRSPHPSPLSAHRGFFGSKPFSKANRFLVENGMEPIDWQIPSL